MLDMLDILRDASSSVLHDPNIFIIYSKCYEIKKRELTDVCEKQDKDEAVGHQMH